MTTNDYYIFSSDTICITYFPCTRVVTIETIQRCNSYVYNFNQALLTEIAEKDANLMTELNRISDALDAFANTIEKYDPSQEIEFPDKITIS